MLVGISLVYLLMVILVRSLLVFLVILCMLPLRCAVASKQCHTLRQCLPHVAT
jgi:hypothetical protein